MTIGTTTGMEAGKAPYERGGPGDTAFRVMALAVQARFDGAIEPSQRLFTVNTDGLWEVYLDAIEDPVERQGLNCHCCHDFIRHYGGLVTLTERGEMRSALWESYSLPEGLPGHYYLAVLALRQEVEKRGVTGEFLWKSGRWGVVEAGGFTHFHVNAPHGRSVVTLSDSQEMAARREEHKTLSAAVGLMKPELVERAVGMLEAGELIRAETLLPMGRFLRDVQARVKTARGEKRSRILWHAVSQASRGWCSPRGSAFGALVEDIESGASVAEIVRRHNVRLDPLHYQRPQAAPSAGNIAQAEKLIETLGLAPALRRRPLALEEAELIWKPAPPRERPVGGVFGHLTAKGEAPEVAAGSLNVKPVVMTFAKFRREVLPKARRMTVRLQAGRMNFCGLTTAVVAEAPPLLAWDRPERRNPAAWYVHATGSYPTTWGLVTGLDEEVVGVSMLPPEWYGTTGFEHQTQGRALFILKGAAEKLGELALFPENLRGELHAVRATIAAHAKVTPLEDEPRQRASGLLLGHPLDVAVHTEHGVASYRIDRVE